MTYKTPRCKDCDSLLWSYHAKQMKLCQDCEDVDSDVCEDLEDQLERLLK